MVVGRMGNQPQTQMMNWRYYPVINGFSQHPITRNLDAIYAKFISTIDTVRAQGIRKTPLMVSSLFSRVLAAPLEVSLDEARLPVDPKLYNAGPQPVAYLLEGNFKSVFRNRPVPVGIRAGAGVASKPSRIVVVSDGDIIRNDVDPKTQQPFRLGFDRYSRATFANKDFLTNATDYLLDESNLISLRTKEIKLRPLNRVKVKEEKSKWQLINLVLPLVLLLLFGLTRFYLRKRKYESRY
jgi:gliding-associated putative ABC transporter substrate-binding component GldG